MFRGCGVCWSSHPSLCVWPSEETYTPRIIHLVRDNVQRFANWGLNV